MLSTIQFTRFLKENRLAEKKRIKKNKSAETLCLEDKQKYSLNRHLLQFQKSRKRQIVHKRFSFSFLSFFNLKSSCIKYRLFVQDNCTSQKTEIYKHTQGNVNQINYSKKSYYLS